MLFPMTMKEVNMLRPFMLSLLLLCGLFASPSLIMAQPLRYAGATTLQIDFMPEAARAFQAKSGVTFEIAGGNTDPGLRALQADKIDLAGAGRFLSAAEKATGLVETLVGWDALVIVVNQANPVGNLSMAQLRDIFAGRIVNWREVGGSDQPILVVTSPEGSGMRSTVKKEILKGEEFTARGIVAALVADADRQVAQFPVAITAISKSMVDAEGVKVIQVDGISPDQTSIAARRYPLVKPLTLVTLQTPRGEAARFIEFVLNPEGQRIMARKFFPVKIH
jgi:phosphate transport system substrate-binding protein